MPPFVEGRDEEDFVGKKFSGWRVLVSRIAPEPEEGLVQKSGGAQLGVQANANFILSNQLHCPSVVGAITLC